MDKQIDEIRKSVLRLYDDVTHTDAGQIDLDRVREHFAELHDALYARQDPPALSPGAFKKRAKRAKRKQSAFDRAMEFPVEDFYL